MEFECIWLERGDSVTSLWLPHGFRSNCRFFLCYGGDAVIHPGSPLGLRGVVPTASGTGDG